MSLYKLVLVYYIKVGEREVECDGVGCIVCSFGLLWRFRKSLRVMFGGEIDCLVGFICVFGKI